MNHHHRRCISIAAISAAIGLLGQHRVLAQNYFFEENFAAPPLTEGTPEASWEDGWLDGENGWTLSERFGGQYANWGQHSNQPDNDVIKNWPHGDFNKVG